MLHATERQTVLLGLVLAAGTACVACAQAFPQRPLRLIVPYGPGGGLDLTARLFTPGLSQSLGKTVVIDNRPGAGGQIGLEMTARATPDGHTIAMTSASNVIQSVIGISKVNIFRELTPVTQVITTPYAFVAASALPVRSIRELIAYAKANPRKLNYGSTGNGTLQHLAMELFLQQADIEALHVPYKGVAAALPDLAAARTHIMLSSLSALATHIRANTLRALAIGTRVRSPSWPDLPTMTEAGVPGYEVSQWQGVVAPAGTPSAIAARLQSGIARATRSPEVASVFAADGSTLVASTPGEFKAALEADRKKWEPVVKRAGLRPN